MKQEGRAGLLEVHPRGLKLSMLLKRGELIEEKL